MIKSAMLIGIFFLFAGSTQKVMAQGEDVSLQSFYDELSPYGTWIQDPQYGYVWRPDVDQEEFRPYYTNGRWAMTEYGNTWVSDYDWGWAPFHYGRWIYNRYNQWVWLPDTVWGPAWVSWRSGGGYYGWAPLGPSINIGINIGRGGYRIPDMCWNFIPYNNIYYNSYPRYYGNRNRVYIQNTVIINNTYIRNNRTYYTGPRADDIYRHTNQRVTVYNVNRSNNSGRTRIDRNTVNIYQPRPSRNSNGTPAPRTVVQGNINRGPVSSGRDNNMASNRYENRGGRNVGAYNRGGSGENRPENSSANRPSRIEGMNGMSSRPNNENQSRPGSFDRNGARDNQAQRTERINPNSQREQSRVERMESPQRSEVPRMERSREAQPQNQPQSQPQRMERRAESPQRMERPQQQSQPRMDRQPQQSQPRVERSQPQQRSSGGGSEGRSGGGGRPGRG